MVERIATCRCGRLRAICAGDPVRVSVCHCLNCQKRSGSVFAVQARFPDEQVTLIGPFREWRDVAESGTRTTFRFCASCGVTVTYVSEEMPGLMAVPVGAFADPTFPPPSISGYEDRQHPWTAVLGDRVEHFD